MTSTAKSSGKPRQAMTLEALAAKIAVQRLQMDIDDDALRNRGKNRTEAKRTLLKQIHEKRSW
ncbi:MAG: hypothetical protein ACFBZ9_18545 [Sphingomonadales bacterium]